MSSRLSLLEVLAQVPDPRSRHGRRHPLPAILSLAVVAMLAGAKSYQAIAQYGREQGFALAHALGFTRGHQVHLRLDASTLSRNVERLRARGWLEVVPGEDARTQPFRLTAQGRRVLERAVPAWEQAQQQAEELLGEDGVALLTKTASKMGMP